MANVQQASVLLAGGAILFAVLWFAVKAVVGHILTHWAIQKIKKRGWGRQEKKE